MVAEQYDPVDLCGDREGGQIRYLQAGQAPKADFVLGGEPVAVCTPTAISTALDDRTVKLQNHCPGVSPGAFYLLSISGNLAPEKSISGF